VLAGILAGIVPAWILSSFKPIQVLRGINTQKVFGSLSLRKSLIVFQFALSIVVIIFLTVFYKQFDYMRTANTGFATNNIIIIPFTGDPQVIAAEISRVSGVKSIGFTSSHLGQRTPGNVMLFEHKDLASYHQFGQYFADSALINIMELELAAGENLGASEKYERYILINEKAARSLGFQNPADAVGSHYFLQDSTSLEVRGVIKDFYHRSVGHTIEPLVFRNVPQQFREIIIMAEPGVREHLASRIESAWKKVYPDNTFEFAWFDEKIKDMNDQTASISLLGFLAFMTIAIATMGLLGLVVYTVETRRKEISIRKIIGASAPQIMTLLSAGYIKLLLIAGVIAIPAGYMLSTFFLINFVNRIALDLTPLLFGFALLLFVGLITILSQTFHASMENPSKNLRSE
jgi:putative ABC transport system permease protein